MAARLIGLTGGIATGKSTVAALLAARGAVVVDADRLAREVVAAGTPGLAAVVEDFGHGVLDAAGALDRAALGAIVFGDAAARRRLEAITHPRIGTLLAERAAAALASEAALVVLDIPLLLETGRDHGVEGVLLAACDRDTQLRRLRARDGLDQREAERRVAAQMPMEDKRRLATWVIDTSATRSQTEAAVDSWWRRHVGSSPRQ